MNIPFVVETVLHDGLLKYKFKNSKIRSITTKPGKSKGAIFAYRSKKSMIGGRGVVLTSEEAIHENQDTFTHWTPNVYRYGTYADENRSYTKGHSENNLRQFFLTLTIKAGSKKHLKWKENYVNAEIWLSAVRWLISIYSSAMQVSYVQRLIV